MHDKWHKQKQEVLINGTKTVVNFGSGGPFNAAWRTFIDGQAKTAAEIRAFVGRLRTGPVRITVPDSSGLDRIFEAQFTKDGLFIYFVP